MSNNLKYIKPNPAIVNFLKELKFPINTIRDITGVDTKSLLVLIDDGPTIGKYQTFGYYIIDWNYSANLVEALKNVKKKYNISERTISYKGRKDKLKRNAFADWIKEVRNYPGLLYVTAFDNSAKKTKEYKKDYEEIKLSLEEHNFKGGFNVYEKMSQVLSFLSAITQYFYSGLNIIFFIDPDTIIDTNPKFKVVNYSLSLMLKELVSLKLGNISFMTKFNENHGDKEEQDESKLQNLAIEEILSIPDIACSSFSAMLDKTTNEDILCPDDETSEIIAELAKFENILDYQKKDKFHCAFGLSIFDINYSKEGFAFYTHNTLKFKKTELDN